MTLSKEADALVKQIESGLQRQAAAIQRTEAKLAEMRKTYAADTKRFATITAQLEGYFNKE